MYYVTWQQSGKIGLNYFVSLCSSMWPGSYPRVLPFSSVYFIFCHTDVQKTRKSKYLKSWWWGSPREATRLTRNGLPRVNYSKTVLGKCTSYYGSICALSLLFDLLLAAKGYSLGSVLFPSPWKNPNLNFMLKAVTQFNKFLRTPRCYYS